MQKFCMHFLSPQRNRIERIRDKIMETKLYKMAAVLRGVENNVKTSDAESKYRVKILKTAAM